MKPYKRCSDRCTRGKLNSPGCPPVWQREQLSGFWQAIASGKTSEDAAVSVGVSAPVGARWFRNGGGMPPTHLAPSAKLSDGRYLTFSEREDIALELAKGQSIRSIARKLGRSPSTISREVRRNAATRGGTLDYRASTAQWHADRSSRRPRPGKLTMNPALRTYVQDQLAGTITSSSGVRIEGPEVQWKGRCAVHRQSRRWSTAWSPEQIAHRLRFDFPEDLTITRPFIKRYIFKAVAHYVASLARACVPGEFCACPANGLAIAENLLSMMRS